MVLPPEIDGSIRQHHPTNRAAVLLNYRLGDAARFAEGACRCGRQTSPIDRPLGRVPEVFRPRDGRLLDPFVFGVVVREWPALWECRFVQHRYDLIEDNLSLSPPRPEALEELRRVLEEKAGSAVRFELRLVERIDHEGLKFRAFVCRLEEENRNPGSTANEPANGTAHRADSPERRSGEASCFARARP